MAFLEAVSFFSGVNNVIETRPVLNRSSFILLKFTSFKISFFIKFTAKSNSTPFYFNYIVPQIYFVFPKIIKLIQKKKIISDIIDHT